MMQASDDGGLPRRLDWDGSTLRVYASAGQRVELRLDGVRYATVDGDANGRVDIALPQFPNGQTRINLSLCVGELESAAVAIAWGVPGLQRAGDVPPVRALAAEEYLDAATATQVLCNDVAIVIPVYNAPAAAQACIASVLAHTRGRARLIVIDDASPDPQVAPMLEGWRHDSRITLLRNVHNMGFTASANRGIELAGRADVVLLNADTEVAAQWLCGLRRAAGVRADIASATAVSDNAGAFSVPELEQENPLPPGWTFAQAARAVWQSAGSAYPRLPTGNGFCLYIKRAALDAVGVLDAEAFAQGYGEENDWCQRAEAAGWQHVIAGNVLVRHARSLSFGHERRQQLGERGMAVLRERWPRYEADVGATLFSAARRVVDWRIRRCYAESAPLPRVLLWSDVSDVTGLSVTYAWYRVEQQAAVVRVLAWQDDTWEVLEQLGSERATAAVPTSLASTQALLVRLLQRHAIDVLVGDVAAPLRAVAALLGTAVCSRVDEVDARWRARSDEALT